MLSRSFSCDSLRFARSLSPRSWVVWSDNIASWFVASTFSRITRFACFVILMSTAFVWSCASCDSFTTMSRFSLHRKTYNLAYRPIINAYHFTYLLFTSVIIFLRAVVGLIVMFEPFRPAGASSVLVNYAVVSVRVKNKWWWWRWRYTHLAEWYSDKGWLSRHNRCNCEVVNPA